MIALIIIGAILLLLTVLVFLPITLDLDFDSELVLKIKYLGITLFDNKKPTLSKKGKKKTSNDTAPKSKDNFIKKTYKQKGLLGSISYFSDIIALVTKRLWRVVKRFKFRRFKLDVVVATADAANTAIQYGNICAAVYPVISLLQTITDFKLDGINISADFDKTKSQFKASVLVKTQLIYLLIAAIGIVVQFLKLQRKERENT